MRKLIDQPKIRLYEDESAINLEGQIDKGNRIVVGSYDTLMNDIVEGEFVTDKTNNQVITKIDGKLFKIGNLEELI